MQLGSPMRFRCRFGLVLSRQARFGSAEVGLLLARFRYKDSKEVKALDLLTLMRQSHKREGS
mgnify:CR=1 FL=1